MLFLRNLASHCFAAYFFVKHKKAEGSSQVVQKERKKMTLWVGFPSDFPNFWGHQPQLT